MAEEKYVVEYTARDGQQIKLTPQIVKKFLVSGKGELVTDQEFYYFVGVCKSRGLNPFNRDCYIVKYSADPAAIITSIDFYRKRAKARDDCQGWECGIIVQTKDGKIEDRRGLILDNEKLLGGWFEAQPKGWLKAFRKEVNLKGYIKKKADGTITRFWAPENQPSQISKVAEAQGLRSIWGDDFQGLYVDAEMQSEGAQAEFDKILGSDGVQLEEQKEDPAVIDEKFNDIMPKNIHPDVITEFVERAAKGNKITPDQAKAEALKDPEGFLKILRAYAKTKQLSKKDKAQKPEETKPVVVEKKKEEVEPEPVETELADDDFEQVTCPYDGEIMSEVFCNTECMKRAACKAWK